MKRLKSYPGVPKILRVLKMAKICSADRDRTTLGRRIDVLELAGTQNLDQGAFE